MASSCIIGVTMQGRCRRPGATWIGTLLARANGRISGSHAWEPGFERTKTRGWHGACSEPQMEPLQSCEHLRREHRLIGDVVAGLGTLAERRDAGADVSALPI